MSHGHVGANVDALAGTASIAACRALSAEIAHIREYGAGTDDAARSRMLKTSLCWTVAALTGCMAPTSYVYAPQEASHWADGYPTATVLVPPEAPQGTLELSSSGFVVIRAEGREQSVLHVRLTITNDGDVLPWTIVPDEQSVDVSGEQRSLPIAMKQALPMNEPMVIELREQQPLDLYFALPAAVAGEDELMGFDVLWQVTTPARLYSSRTHFDRYLSTDPSLWSRADRR